MAMSVIFSAALPASNNKPMMDEAHPNADGSTLQELVPGIPRRPYPGGKAGRRPQHGEDGKSLNMTIPLPGIV
jgi:hypothetical protein